MEFDYVVVGGGSAGAVIARRLADARIGTVALIEAGPSDEHDPTMLDISRVYEQASETDWGFAASKLSGARATLNYSRARVLGGCGSHNDCAWLVPPASDFDEWVRLGAEGWSPPAVSEAFRRLEARVNVEPRPPTHPVTAAFLKAGEELGMERVDYRAGIAPGVGMLSLNARGRLRQSASVAYLHPLSALPDTLAVLTETLVLRVLFRDGRAIGCETDRGPVGARAEVIVAAGAIQSPQLLAVSGIGDPEELRDLGIAPVSALPGVGRNLADHVSASAVFSLRERVPDWEVTPYEAVMLLRIDPDAPAPDCLAHFGLCVGSPEGRHGEGALERAAGDAAVGDRRVDIAPNVARPRSRGRVRTVSPDMRDRPLVALDYFSDPDGYDLRIVREGLVRARAFFDAPAFRALAEAELAPGPDLRREDELDDYIRSRCETVYHACGTCRMGAADDPLAVLTPDLRVKGIAGLRVCDASSFPAITTVNVNSTVMMLAERAAELILADARRRDASLSAAGKDALAAPGVEAH